MVGEEEVERPLKERVSPVKTMGQLEARLVSSETSMAVPRVAWRSPFITWRPVPTSSSKTSPPKLKIEEVEASAAGPFRITAVAERSRAGSLHASGGSGSRPAGTGAHEDLSGGDGSTVESGGGD